MSLGSRITFKKSVAKDLKRIDKTQRGRILDSLEKDLSACAEQCPESEGKFKGLRKYRVGDYRVIFTLLEDTILILRVQHRKDVYR
ncbi:type II toxin-antitoxin system RelE/ParE family toxin [Oscillatoria laete-virens NRMC-F 0139]|nr:type II toxin-antitoxin system RelE/ParE family toxin [Oscillatoria laete-virens]MDL5055753.1 type II toxin-antitoxin system RelE/ParE family toxin [Oscillatoria laete-virens NRMC-F 0139]